MIASPLTAFSARARRRQTVSWILLGFAAAWLALWGWSRICLFPENAWNDVRLAPTIALSRGIAVYPTAAHGVISTWTYGPLPILLFWPASWASTAAGAMQIAAVLNFLVVVLPIAAVCCWWPTEPNPRAAWARAAAFLLCVAIWPQRSFDYHQCDNLAIACALVGNLVLIRASRPVHYWIAAALAMGAIGCKQITIGIPAAQLAWLLIRIGPRAAVRHAVRCIGTGLALAGTMIAAFGAKGLWFVLLQMPARFPWGQGLGHWLVELAPPLAWQVGVPAAAMALFRRWFSRPELLLPALAWAFAIPLGVIALLKQGGDLNSLHCAWLWLPPVATSALCTLELRSRFAPAWLVSATIVLLAMGRIGSQTRTVLRPQVEDYRSAEIIVKAYPQQVWFPWNPLISLYGDGRYYHDEDGLHVRLACRLPVTIAELHAHLPRQVGAIAVRRNWMDWGVARQLFPVGTEPRNIANWSLWVTNARESSTAPSGRM